MDTNQIIFSLGSNMGSRESYIEEMERELEEIIGGSLTKSRLMETEPVGVVENQAWYLNRIVSGKYNGTPCDLLKKTLAAEKKLGRTGKGRLTARTADIDILLFGNVVVNSPELRIPHPGILKRRFCIEGIVDCLGDVFIEPLNKTTSELYKSMDAQVLAQNIRWL